MCDKEDVKLHEILQALAKRTPMVLVALKRNMVGGLCMIGIASSSSVMIVVAGVFNVVVRRQK